MCPVIGIDIGLNGGIGIIYPWLIGTNLEAKVFEMPTLKSPNGKGRMYDLKQICKIMPATAIVYIEKQNPFPGQGVVSAGRLMQGQGMFLGICAARFYKHELVSPKTWQKEMLAGELKGDTKAASISKCQKLYPFVELTPGKCSKPKDGMSDALLIASYGARRNYGNN